MRYLTKDEIIYINNSQTHSSGVLDSHGLDAIVEQPKQVFFGREAYPTIWLKAAFYLQKIAKKHVFVDGNKRTAMGSMVAFLRLNGYDLNIDKSQFGKFVLEITTSVDSQVVMLAIAKYLEKVAVKCD